MFDPSKLQPVDPTLFKTVQKATESDPKQVALLALDAQLTAFNNGDRKAAMWRYAPTSDRWIKFTFKYGTVLINFYEGSSSKQVEAAYFPDLIEWMKQRVESGEFTKQLEEAKAIATESTEKGRKLWASLDKEQRRTWKRCDRGLRKTLGVLSADDRSKRLAEIASQLRSAATSLSTKEVPHA